MLLCFLCIILRLLWPQGAQGMHSWDANLHDLQTIIFCSLMISYVDDLHVCILCIYDYIYIYVYMYISDSITWMISSGFASSRLPARARFVAKSAHLPIRAGYLGQAARKSGHQCSRGRQGYQISTIHDDRQGWIGINS